MVIIQSEVSGYQKSPQQIDFPWQLKQGPEDSTNIKALFCRTKKGDK